MACGVAAHEAGSAGFRYCRSSRPKTTEMRGKERVGCELGVEGRSQDYVCIPVSSLGMDNGIVSGQILFSLFFIFLFYWSSQ